MTARPRASLRLLRPSHPLLRRLALSRSWRRLSSSAAVERSKKWSFCAAAAHEAERVSESQLDGGGGQLGGRAQPGEVCRWGAVGR